VGAREYESWRRYWSAEPWGPWRDNLHTAILAKEIRRPQMQRGARINLESFMVQDPTKRAREASANLWNFLTVIAKPKAA
jgi:hypothetical protein